MGAVTIQAILNDHIKETISWQKEATKGRSGLLYSET